MVLSSPRLLITHPPNQPTMYYICHHPPKLPLLPPAHNHSTTETPHNFGKSGITVATAMVASSGLRAAESPPPPPLSIHQHVPGRGSLTAIPPVQPPALFVAEAALSTKPQ